MDCLSFQKGESANHTIQKSKQTKPLTNFRLLSVLNLLPFIVPGKRKEKKGERLSQPSGKFQAAQVSSPGKIIKRNTSTSSVAGWRVTHRRPSSSRAGPRSVKQSNQTITRTQGRARRPKAAGGIGSRAAARGGGSRTRRSVIRFWRHPSPSCPRSGSRPEKSPSPKRWSVGDSFRSQHTKATQKPGGTTPASPR